MCDKNLDEIPCRQKPCLPPRERKPSETGDVNAGLKGRPVLYTGVVWIGIVRRFLIPRTCGSGTMVSQRPQEAPASPKVVAHVQAQDSGLQEPPLRYKQKPVPVPLVTEHREKTTDDQKAASLRRRNDDGDSSASPLRALVVQVHEASVAVATQARGITQDLSAILRDSQETTAEVIDTVRSEEGRKFRLAAITASGLVGYLAGLKRGVVTRLVYSATGATAMATICYPEDTKTYNRHSLATVRRWIVLGLSFMHRGPQKPLGNGNIRISDITTTSNENETKTSNDCEQIPSNSFSAEKTIATLMQNLGTLGHHLEEIQAKLKDSSSTTVTNESTKENITNSVNPGDSESAAESSLDCLPHFKSDLFENFEKNITKDIFPGSVPYSPSLPIPPKVNHGNMKFKIPSSTKKDALITTPLEETVTIKKKTSSEFIQSQATDDLSGSADDDDDDNGDDYDVQQKQNSRDFSDMFFVVPTDGLDEKLDGRQEQLKKTHHDRNSETPLNKKLTVYYRNIPEEEKTSREKGYDDAYSNRGK